MTEKIMKAHLLKNEETTLCGESGSPWINRIIETTMDEICPGCLSQLQTSVGRRGYFGIGIYSPKKSSNIGTLWRSAYNFGASFIFTINRRYREQCSDTTKAHRHTPLFHYDDFGDFYEHLPYGCQLIGVEQTRCSYQIRDFIHPERCAYLLGSEDGGLPKNVLDKCRAVIEIPSPYCLNVAVAGSIVMFDRRNKE